MDTPLLDGSDDGVGDGYNSDGDATATPLVSFLSHQQLPPFTSDVNDDEASSTGDYASLLSGADWVKEGTFDDLSEDEKKELAVLWYHDAIHFRTAHPMHEGIARWSHALLHSRGFRILRKTIIFLHLMLAFFEFPSDLLLPPGVSQAVELCACVLYTMELRLAWSIREKDGFIRSRLLLVKCVVLFLTAADATVFSFLWPWRFRPLRALRVFYVVENSRDLRSNFTQFAKLLPRVLGTLTLLLLVLIVYAIVGIILFGQMRHTEYPHYFDTFPDALLRLFTLLTTVNFPDVMLPAYAHSQFYALYFCSFVLIGIYFLLNLVLAIVLSSYRAFLRQDYNHKVEKQTTALMAVYNITSPHEHMTLRLFVDLMKRAHPTVAEEHIVTVFRVLDLNHDNHLDRVQFISVCTTFQALLHVHSSSRLHSRHTLSSNAFPACVQQSRRACQKLMRHRYTTAIVNVVLFANVVTILVQAIQITNGSFDGRWLYFDVVFLAFFFLELSCKLWGMGLTHFMHSNWNRYESAIVLIAIIAECFTLKTGTGALLYRCGIIFRVIARIPVFQDLLSLAGRLVPPFAVNFLAVFVLYYVFAILGICLFYERLPLTEQALQTDPRLADTLYLEANYWNVRFDSFSRAMIILFELTVVNNWHVTASGVIAVTSMWASLYFVVFYIVCVVIMINVIVAFFLDIFSVQLEARGASIEAFNPLSSSASTDGAASSITEWKIITKNRARAILADQMHHLDMLHLISGGAATLGVEARDSDSDSDSGSDSGSEEAGRRQPTPLSRNSNIN